LFAKLQIQIKNEGMDEPATTTSFEYGGRPIKEWVVELVSPDGAFDMQLGMR
jgi:hypothetical protein